MLMLCGLGAAIFATTATRWDSAAAMAAGFGAAVVFIRPELLPDAGWTGSIVAVVAALHIFRRDVRFLGPICGGALAGIWSALLETQGLPREVSLAVAAMLPAVSALLTVKRPAFAPESLREEALLVMCALGLGVAMIPDILSGWRSALALNRQAQDNANHIIANWVLVLSAISVALGGLYSFLRRR
jgi:hypothetical protein